MGVYEDKQRKEREALDEKFKAQARPLADRLRKEIEQATGLKPKESVQDGSYAIEIWISEPSISVRIEHDWGAGHHHHYSSQPTGKPKIGLNTGRHSYGKTWFRPNKDGEFNIEKIVKNVSETVERHNAQAKYRQESEVKKAENERLKAAELEGIKVPDGVVVTRNYGPESYTFSFGGTFSGLNVLEVANLAESFKKLIAQYKFEKSWRMDY